MRSLASHLKQRWTFNAIRHRQAGRRKPLVISDGVDSFLSALADVCIGPQRTALLLRMGGKKSQRPKRVRIWGGFARDRRALQGDVAMIASDFARARRRFARFADASAAPRLHVDD